MDSDVRSDMITLDGRGPTGAPSADEIEVVCALATDMTFADMVLNCASSQYFEIPRNLLDCNRLT